MKVGTVVVDFDGTACSHDVAEHLLGRFADGDWESLDEAWERGALASQQVVAAQSAMLGAADRDTLIRYAASHCAMDPTFGPFVAWAHEHAIEVAIASDGFGFYIEPLLAIAGVPTIPVISNDQRWDGVDRPARLDFPNRHAECVGCGTCKMNAVLDRRASGAVAFVGEGSSDRYGALYADVTFAKLALVAHCERDGIEFVPWNDFDDVRRWLEGADPLPGPVSPERCPGWTVP